MLSLCLLEIVKKNRSENKSNVAHHKCQAPQNNLVLIYRQDSPIGQKHVLFRKTTNQVDNLSIESHLQFIWKLNS